MRKVTNHQKSDDVREMMQHVCICLYHCSADNDRRTDCDTAVPCLTLLVHVRDQHGKTRTEGIAGSRDRAVRRLIRGVLLLLPRGFSSVPSFAENPISQCYGDTVDYEYEHGACVWLSPTVALLGAFANDESTQHSTNT